MRKVYLILGILGLLLSFSLNSFSQISQGGTPPSATYKSYIDSTFDVITLAPINVFQAQLEDSMRPGPLWVGRSIPVGVSMETAGSWTNVPNGASIWRLEITSAGAKAIGVYYDQFYLPEGSKLFLYNGSKTQVIGAFTHENNPASGTFSTELIQGETVILEYVAPIVALNKYDPNQQPQGLRDGDQQVWPGNHLVIPERPRISISEIVYVYRDVPFLEKYDLSKAPTWGSSGTCNVNVNCTEGASWQSQKKGVAEIFIKNGASYGFCTGSLVNTTNNSGTPYFLTADHCRGTPNAVPAEPFASAADMLLWQFYFKYETVNCTGSPQPGYSTLTGCELKASSPIDGGSDFCLVLLSTTPPQSYNPYYNGWDRTNTAATSGVGIHHPAGDVKKISTYSASATTGTFNGGTGLTCQTNAHWNVTYVATTNGHGIVEGGSSGSPLFNQVGRVVGALSGGNSSCTNLTGSNLYGKFYNHWDLMGTLATQRLKPWLDPGTTNLTVVNGYDPFSGFPDFYGTPTTIYEGESVNFTDLTNSATSWTWAFDGGTPATSAIQNPTNIVYYQQGTYKVKLTTVTVAAGQQSIEKVAYITVLPGPRPSAFWCDNFSTPANWTMSTSGGYTDNWAITTAAPTGTYSAGLGRIASSSGGNYALFDSDALGATGDNQWANITTTNGQNCSTYGGVTLKFEQNYRKYYDSTLVYVSSDNFVTSKRYVVNSTYANNGTSTNPDIQYIDISSAAAGKTNVKIRFTFRSTQNMGTLAGWGYAWEIDDVCLTGVGFGNDLPIPDFTATTTTDISPGQNVSYQDLSQFTTSWLWTFEGGTPATSTAQNPTNIVYNTEGYYSVTLAATNQNGTVPITKTFYVHVFNGCSYDDSNIQQTDDLTYYGAPGTYWGYTPGHNGELIAAYADKVDIGNMVGTVKSFAVGVAKADSMAGATDVTFTMWSNNAGVPGTVLMTKAVRVYTLQAGAVNIVNFPPVSVNSSFFVGFQLTYPANVDTFACFLGKGAVGRTNTAYAYSGGTWVPYLTKYGVNASLYIYPEFCLDQGPTARPTADFVASQTSITPGTVISYTDQSAGGPAPTAWAWTLPGGAPTAPIVQNPPTETYAAAGLYDAQLIKRQWGRYSTQTRLHPRCPCFEYCVLEFPSTRCHR
jgi:PKD repeat protein